MKYVLFIAMDLAVYPFLLLFYVAKCIFEKIQLITNDYFLFLPIIRTFVLTTQKGHSCISKI